MCRLDDSGSRRVATRHMCCCGIRRTRSSPDRDLGASVECVDGRCFRTDSAGNASRAGCWRSRDRSRVSSSSDPELQGVLELTGLDQALIMSLTTRNEFIGLLVIGAVTRPEGWTEVTRERLAGIASLASTALGGLTLLDEVRHQAFHDSITNLPNTRLFEDRISQAITTGRRTGTRHGFLFIDLDRFKMINDGHGHKMGDDLIREVAKRLTGCVRDTDTVARVGGDEFAVLVQDLREEEDAAAIARKIVAALQRPFRIRGMTADDRRQRRDHRLSVRDGYLRERALACRLGDVRGQSQRTGAVPVLRGDDEEQLSLAE